MDTKRLKMHGQQVIETVIENPKAVVATGVTSAMLADRLIINPYAKCGVGMTLFSFIFTLFLINGFVTLAVIDWFHIFDKLIGLIVQLIGAFGSALTVYALYKKTFRTTRRRKIDNERKKHRDRLKEFDEQDD